MLGIIFSALRSTWKIHLSYILVLVLLYVEHSLENSAHIRAYDRLSKETYLCKADISLQNKAFLSLKSEGDRLERNQKKANERALKQRKIAYEEIDKLKKKEFSSDCETAVRQGIEEVSK